MIAETTAGRDDRREQAGMPALLHDSLSIALRRRSYDCLPMKMSCTRPSRSRTTVVGRPEYAAIARPVLGWSDSNLATTVRREITFRGHRIAGDDRRRPSLRNRH